MANSDTALPTTSELRAVSQQRREAPHHASDAGERDEPRRIEKTDLIRIGLVGVAIVVSWLHPWTLFDWAVFQGEPGAHEVFASWLQRWKFLGRFDLAAFVATLAGGYPLFREALADLRERRMTMELSMTVALAAAMLVGEFRTSLVIVFFVLIAEVLEELTLSRGRSAIKALLDLLPQSAVIRDGGGTQEVSAAEIRVGDIVVLKPGARLPADGVVIKGQSFVDQSTITGESLPIEKIEGSEVYAGTINQSGALELRALRLGRDTAYGKIIEAVERAEKSRAPVQKTADRLAGYIVYFALGCAALTFLITRDVRSSISVVVVAGACGIAAGTPLALLGAIGRAAHAGAVVKGGLYVEILARIDTVALDKTGTVTFGNPEVTAVCSVREASMRDVVEAAALAERLSEHPLGKAILKTASKMSVVVREPDRFEYIPGKGIICTLGTEEIVAGNRALLAERGCDVNALAACPDHLSEVVVSRGGRLLGSIRIADVIRPEAVSAVQALRQMGIRTVLLTGDTAAIARDVGRALGVDEVCAELLPEQKVSEIENLLSGGRKVAMVGDGINDAPALMRASVGVAVGSGTDVARESANVVLLGNDLLKLVETVRVARRCYRIIMANFVGTLLTDAAGVGLAAYGLLNPMLATLIHVSSEMAFILNSARLLPTLSKKRESVTRDYAAAA